METNFYYLFTFFSNLSKDKYILKFFLVEDNILGKSLIKSVKKINEL